MTSDKFSDLVYDWGGYDFDSRKVTVLDTTLRDGLQSPHPKLQPSIEEKKQFISSAQDLGIEVLEIGFPAASPTHCQDVVELAKFAHKRNPRTLLSCLARTTRDDILAVAKVAHESRAPVTANLLIGSSKIRRLVETWDIDQMVDWIGQCIALAYENGLTVEFVTEDATRTDPKTLKLLYGAAIDKGVKRVWIADTVGVATPKSAQNISSYFIKSIIGNKDIGLDWHGHDDKGLGVANSLAAVVGGADRIQGTALAVGERAGNTSLESVIINLVLAGSKVYDLKKLNQYSQTAAKMFGLDIHPGYPGTGQYVFSTAAGMHAAAIYKARQIKHSELEGLVYCPFHPSLFNRKIDILIGPMSGKANVKWNLQKMKLQATDTQIEKILELAKSGNRYLTHEDINQVLIQNN